MSEHDGTDDPYRTPGPRSGEPGQPSADPYGQPFQGRPFPGEPYPGQPYPSQPYPGQPYPGQPYGPSSGAGGLDLPAKPPSVVLLVQVMLAGAVAALLQGLYAAFTLDDALVQSEADLEQIAVDSGMDPAALADMFGTVGLVAVAVGTVIAVGLWLLFARLFDRGSGRVVGTVLGALNGAGLLLGLLQPGDLLGFALAAVEAAVVVTALVLLWRPATSAWFGAVAAARARTSWG